MLATLSRFSPGTVQYTVEEELIKIDCVNAREVFDAFRVFSTMTLSRYV